MGKTIGIVGGGAAGMMAAITAAGQGASVTLFEGNDRLGKKLLATGNGKCNLDNLAMDAGMYYSKTPKLLDTWLTQFDTQAVVAFFEGLGLLIKSKNGYLYPLSEQASTVLDVLRFRIERDKNIRLQLQTKIDRIAKDKGDGIRLWSGSQSFVFDRVILACGGKAAGNTGSDGSGYALAKMLGHTLVPVVPALVQLKCREEWCRAVAGVRADARLSFRGEDGQPVAERGELQLTDYGISGIPVFQLSRQVNYILKKEKELRVDIDFLPDYPLEGFGQSQYAARRNGGKARTVEEYFTGLLNKKLMLTFIRLSGLKPSDTVGDVPKEALMRVFALCRQLTVHVTGSNSFEHAQVCAGGVPLTEVTGKLASVCMPGVFLAGELLDVDGRCGGYNLHWAWCSGHIAGMAASMEKPAGCGKGEKKCYG